MTTTPEQSAYEERRKIAREERILVVEVGSSAHGLQVEGTDDEDLMGVCIPPPTHVIGLGTHHGEGVGWQRFQHLVERDRPAGVRSEPGDTDFVTYSLHKYCALCLKGNPSALVALFAPVRESTELGLQLRDIAPSFASKKAGRAFLGYMTQQRERLLGERGQMNVKRPELVEAFGFDTKYAGHVLRLGHQGIEYMKTGTLKLPMEEPWRTLVLQTRTGNVDFHEVIERAVSLEIALEELLVSSPLPDAPDYALVNDWMTKAHFHHWRKTYE